MSPRVQGTIFELLSGLFGWLWIGAGIAAVIFAGLILAAGGAGAGFHEDANLCLATADRVKRSEDVSPEEKSAAHEACLRALAASGNIVQKYHLQEADFDVMGTRPGQ